MAWKPDYALVTELAGFMRILDNLDDTVLGMAISASSRAIDYATNRQFGNTSAAEERFYEPYWNSTKKRWCVETDDISSNTDFAVDWDLEGDLTYTTEITDYRMVPLNANQNGRPWEGLILNNVAQSGNKFSQVNHELRITAIFGWPSVPVAIKNATLIQASRLVTRRDAPFGVTGSAESGGELRLLSKLDADVEVLVKPYYRWWGAA